MKQEKIEELAENVASILRLLIVELLPSSDGKNREKKPDPPKEE